MNTVCFRVDCSPKVGFGHLKRCIYLAEYLNQTKCVFIIKGTKDISNDIFSNLSQSTTHFLSEKLDFDAEIKQVDEIIKNEKINIIVLDITSSYTFDYIDQIENYLNNLKTKVNKLLMFDGLNDDAIHTKKDNLNIDFLITPYCGSEESKSFSFRHLAGLNYFIYNKNLNSIIKNKEEILDQPRNILITMGGADPARISLTILKAIQNDEVLNHKNVKIIAGSLFKEDYKTEINKIVNSNKCWSLVSDVQDLSQHFAWCDFCITTTGLTKYELAKTRTPAILVAHSKEADQNNKAFNLLDVSHYIGYINNLESEKIRSEICSFVKNFELRKNIWENASKIENGKGVEFIVNEISS